MANTATYWLGAPSVGSETTRAKRFCSGDDVGSDYLQIIFETDSSEHHVQMPQ